MNELLEQTPAPQNCGHDPEVRCPNCSAETARQMSESHAYFEGGGEGHTLADFGLEPVRPDIETLRQAIEDELLRDFPASEPRRKLPSLETLVEYAVATMEKRRQHLVSANAANKRKRATITSLTKRVESRTALLAELFDYVGRLESSMGWTVATRGWYKFPESGDLGDRVKAALGEANDE